MSSFTAFISFGLLLVSFFSNGNSFPFSRILGGLPASPGEFPYQVSLQVFDRSLGEFTPVCGGAIINPTTILSAAHCTLVDPEGLYRIVAGEHDLSVEDGHEQFRIVEHVVIHNGFDEFYYYNDIALYFISPKSPLVFNKFVGPVALPPNKDVELEKTASVAGWGSDSDSDMILKSSSATNILNKITIPIYGADKCREIYEDDYVEEFMMCAGNLDGGQDACAGDSGGPLVGTVSTSGEKAVIGLVSWGSGCGQKNFLGVYTKVTSYIDWIEYVINLLGHND